MSKKNLPVFDESGMTTISYVLATAFSLVIISWSTLFVVFSYTKAAVRGASERASRAGVVNYSLYRDPAQAIAACSATFNANISQAIKNAESFSTDFPDLFDNLGSNLPKLLNILGFQS